MASRKELLRTWNKERVGAFLGAEKRGLIQEAPGGWIIEGNFMEKMPFTGELLTSCLQMLAHEALEAEKASELGCSWWED